MNLAFEMLSMCPSLLHRVDQREWKHRHPERKREVYNRYLRNRRRDDPAFRMLWNLRNRLGNALRSAKAKKLGGTLQWLGCSGQQLVAYIEQRFEQGMSWDNYGEWELDHVRACKNFDLTKLEGQRQCFHFSNLQPLWRTENCSKDSRR
jgi:hypothetical protein